MKETETMNTALELNTKSDELVKVSPLGDVAGVDGRVFKIDANSIIQKIKAQGLDIPLDENHSFAEALGWFICDTFTVRSDGIYAKLELNEKGKALINSKSYRYLSPTFAMANNREVIGIDSIGLVNRPNLLNRALNNQIKENELEEIEKIKELEAQNAQLKTDLNTIKTAFKSYKIDSAIATLKLEPNKREFANKLDDSLLDEFLESNSISHLSKKTEVETNKTHLSEIEKNINAQLGLESDNASK